MGRRWAGRIGGFLFAVAVANFLAFIPHLLALGGGALDGKRVEDRYYVGHNGRYAEVTQLQWQVMLAHEVSMFASPLLVVFVAGPLMAYAECGRRGRPDAEPSSVLSSGDS